MVRRASNGSIGLLHAQTTAVPPRWQVILDGKLMTVAEADLRPHVFDDPHSRIVEGRLGTARQFALAVTARRYEIEQLTNDLVSLGESRVDIKPHQVSVVHRVITNYPHRFLLCDEVGLGKTIEAGMILKELRARGSARASPRHCSSEPGPAVAVRAEVEVQRVVLGHQQRHCQVPAQHAGARWQPIPRLRQRHRVERVGLQPRWAKLAAEVDVGHGDCRRGSPRPCAQEW